MSTNDDKALNEIHPFHQQQMKNAIDTANAQHEHRLYNAKNAAEAIVEFGEYISTLDKGDLIRQLYCSEIASMRITHFQWSKYGDNISARHEELKELMSSTFKVS